MLKKMLITSLSLFMFSNVSHAGGEAPSYYPRVAAITCIMSSSSSSSYFWNNTKDCNDAVTSGYAKGVQYKGIFKYEDGSEVTFNGFITPSQGYTPPHLPGKKAVAILNASASWANWITN
ncbi:hypothetical protein OGY83_18110 [Citrobacter sp. Cpo090]|uniref:hypothetical protein n=1 Tax=Citrobacter TaxID=544 RepID=UPI0025773D3D|nr:MULTISPECIES: hypothetical protein [Citrobacter]MDM2845534.1 hypothetical protein [Citrobacter sp. Cpo090]MEB0967997.1 hypothetical protein [Citrobacter braakii]